MNIVNELVVKSTSPEILQEDADDWAELALGSAFGIPAFGVGTLVGAAADKPAFAIVFGGIAAVTTTFSVVSGCIAFKQSRAARNIRAQRSPTPV